jgi:hypothetical protein
MSTNPIWMWMPCCHGRPPKKVKEGNYKDSDFIIFDHKKRTANSRRGVLSIPENTHDIISAIYYARTTDMSNANPGDVFPINFYLDHKNYEFRFKFLGRKKLKPTWENSKP